MEVAKTTTTKNIEGLWGCACQQGWHRLNIRLHKCFGYIVLCLGRWRRTKKWRNANRLRASGPWIPPKYFTCRRRRCETAHLILLEIIRWIKKNKATLFIFDYLKIIWLGAFVGFLVDLTTPKGYFKINWPLVSQQQNKQQILRWFETYGNRLWIDEYIFFSKLRIPVSLGKGQMKSECIYEIIDFPKYPQKNLIDFCPESLFRLYRYTVVWLQTDYRKILCNFVYQNLLE